MKRKIRLDRLKYLAREILPYVKRENFNMHHWIEIGSPFPLTPCGTVACAFGHACLSPMGQADGLSLTFDGYGANGIRFYVPRYRRFQDMDAAAAYYGINEDTACDLFLHDSDGNTTAIDVAMKLESLIAAESP